MDIVYNKNYNKKVDVTVGGLSTEQVDGKLKDGRLASHLLELLLEVWFPELTCVDQKGYDHIREGSDILYDQKCFTKGGLGFAPSKMLGAGRKINIEEAHAHANTIDYIACDITEWPNVVVRFVKGSDLVEKYPTCKVKYNQRDEFFA
jgi:hypothetical protein